MHIELTHRLGDARYVEASADLRGDVLRLRARLCERDLVVDTHRRDFSLHTGASAAAVAEFTRQFVDITGVQIKRLFPVDLGELQCPAAPPHWPDALVWGIATGTVEEPQVVSIPPEPLTPELIEAAEPCTPREVYRLSATCIKNGCRHWRAGDDGTQGDGRCTLVERVVAGYPLVAGGKLPPCGVRSVCRWFSQEGPDACRVCPGICTDIGALPQDPEREAEVGFF